ncbi:unnamed protein product [Macrosiphum euphorbiae]|uniref:Uncharacterized protein n=1 Tax=Macrosiphum euphorbiae TaxID=13131 RepID=A0AAV0XNX8_9HEMI|nr:unnamed protein product [Macrosiphum euphorbiae]
MNFILHLSLPYSNRPVQEITEFEMGLCNAMRRVFPQWQQVGRSFHLNQLLALPHLPSNRFVLPNIQGFTISESLMMVRASSTFHLL